MTSLQTNHIQSFQVEIGPFYEFAYTQLTILKHNGKDGRKTLIKILIHACLISIVLHSIDQLLAC